ncbi:hypothetical protein ACFOWB_13135 [Chenggangzhangella methanolivorans]|uniref:hypothetical protein n=1 Tax=Chenggangzhangella methanolivorans TaxID=1437009 RepID=UPI003605F263
MSLSAFCGHLFDGAVTPFWRARMAAQPSASWPKDKTDCQARIAGQELLSGVMTTFNGVLAPAARALGAADAPVLAIEAQKPYLADGGRLVDARFRMSASRYMLMKDRLAGKVLVIDEAMSFGYANNGQLVGYVYDAAAFRKRKAGNRVFNALVDPVTDEIGDVAEKCGLKDKALCFGQIVVYQKMLFTQAFAYLQGVQIRDRVKVLID